VLFRVTQNPLNMLKNSVNKFFENANKDVLNLSDTDFKDNVNSVIIEKKNKKILNFLKKLQETLGKSRKKILNLIIEKNILPY